MAENIIHVEYQATGASTSVNEMGMREMQARAYAARNAQYLLLKAPPASGKSRALMFIALDKLRSGQVSKVIVAVPERSIGGSFKNTALSSHGFHSDWCVEPKNNLCLPGGESSKVTALGNFLDSSDKTLVCTHATLRFAFDKFVKSPMAKDLKPERGVGTFCWLAVCLLHALLKRKKASHPK